MSVQISYSNKKFSSSKSNLVLFFDGKNNNDLKKYVSSNEFSYISDLLKNSDLKKNLFVFELSSKKKLFLYQLKTN